jgi:hypothetical protein
MKTHPKITKKHQKLKQINQKLAKSFENSAKPDRKTSKTLQKVRPKAIYSIILHFFLHIPNKIANIFSSKTNMHL